MLGLKMTRSISAFAWTSYGRTIFSSLSCTLGIYPHLLSELYLSTSMLIVIVVTFYFSASAKFWEIKQHNVRAPRAGGKRARSQSDFLKTRRREKTQEILLLSNFLVTKFKGLSTLQMEKYFRSPVHQGSCAAIPSTSCVTCHAIKLTTSYHSSVSFIANASTCFLFRSISKR